MREVGEILHVSKSGRLIVRLNAKLEPGSMFADSKGRSVARLVELIGPVSKPYGSSIPASSRIGKEGQKVYTSR